MAIQAQLYPENLGFPFGSPQDLMPENGCWGVNQFSLDLQQQPQKQLHHDMQFQQENLGFPFGNQNVLLQKSNYNNGHHSMPFSQNLSALIEKQRQEIDRFISLQNERLKWALQEQRKQQIALMLNKYETKSVMLLRQKDEEIAKATNRTVELEDFLKRMEMEKAAWHRLAKENEVMVLSLNNTIEQLRESACLSANKVEDAESCCDVIDDINQESGEQQIARKTMMICRACNCMSSSIIILPCRHMCLCKACEAFIAVCPVCGIEKKATIEALF